MSLPIYILSYRELLLSCWESLDKTLYLHLQVWLLVQLQMCLRHYVLVMHPILEPLHLLKYPLRMVVYYDSTDSW